jgi:hypothetical protein
MHHYLLNFSIYYKRDDIDWLISDKVYFEHESADWFIISMIVLSRNMNVEFTENNNQQQE